jgi:hypothetical protein
LAHGRVEPTGRVETQDEKGRARSVRPLDGLDDVTGGDGVDHPLKLHDRDVGVGWAARGQQDETRGNARPRGCRHIQYKSSRINGFLSTKSFA